MISLPSMRNKNILCTERLPLAGKMLSLTLVCLLFLLGCDTGSRQSNPRSNPPLADSLMSDDGVESGDFTLLVAEESVVTGRFDVLGGSTGILPINNAAGFTLLSDPRHGGLTLSSDRISFSYQPDLNYFGVDSFMYTGGVNISTVFINISNTNDPPVLHDDIQRVVEQGSQYRVALQAFDPDRDTLHFDATNLPAWISLDDTTGVLFGIPRQSDVGLYENIELGVRDTAGLRDELTGISIEVLDINDAPTLNPAQFPSRLDARQTISVNVFPDDPDGDLVKLAIESNDFLQSSVSGGTITVTAQDVSEVTQINLVVIATDLQGQESREILPLTLFPLTTSGRGRTLLGRGSGSGVHLVVLGDGYRNDQRALFREDVENLIQIMRDDSGVATHLAAWNIHSVDTDSVDSGIDDNFEFDFRDTAFGTGYFCLSIRRLVCGDQLAMFDTALAEYPHLDQLILLVNDNRYGGSGGSVAIASSQYPEIALHEMGHSIAGLADEYVDALIPALNPTEYEEGRFANISRLDNPADVPWARWIDFDSPVPNSHGESGVGVFQGGFYQASAFYRPTSDSRMRTFDAEFGPVNSEQWALNVYRMANPVVEFSPTRQRLNLRSGQEQLFAVTPLFDKTVQSVEWVLDGTVVSTTDDNLQLRLSPDIGVHELTLAVSDVSGIIRKSPPHSGEFKWQWEIGVR